MAAANRINLETCTTWRPISFYTALKQDSFSPLLHIDLLLEYKSFSLISLGDKPLLGDGYARVFFLHMYKQPAWHASLVRR